MKLTSCPLVSLHITFGSVYTSGAIHHFLSIMFRHLYLRQKAKNNARIKNNNLLIVLLFDSLLLDSIRLRIDS
jgi:hypothetical protein